MQFHLIKCSQNETEFLIIDATSFSGKAFLISWEILEK